jgi:quinol-cytochrome oxidoreductase complex cytochrome b subunit
MKDEQKKTLREKYRIALSKGERFWPDSIYKDLLISFAIFLLLLLLATALGVPSEPKADPSDTTYIPRPEWYFLFLFQMLKYFPGKLEWLGTAVIPGLVVLFLLLLPLLDRKTARH